MNKIHQNQAFTASRLRPIYYAPNSYYLLGQTRSGDERRVGSGDTNAGRTSLSHTHSDVRRWKKKRSTQTQEFLATNASPHERRCHAARMVPRRRTTFLFFNLGTYHHGYNLDAHARAHITNSAGGSYTWPMHAHRCPPPRSWRTILQPN